MISVLDDAIFAKPTLSMGSYNTQDFLAANQLKVVPKGVFHLRDKGFRAKYAQVGHNFADFVHKFENS